VKAESFVVPEYIEARQMKEATKDLYAYEYVFYRSAYADRIPTF
jgi:hypothetical protein